MSFELPSLLMSDNEVNSHQSTTNLIFKLHKLITEKYLLRKWPLKSSFVKDCVLKSSSSNKKAVDQFLSLGETGEILCLCIFSKFDSILFI